MQGQKYSDIKEDIRRNLDYNDLKANILVTNLNDNKIKSPI